MSQSRSTKKSKPYRRTGKAIAGGVYAYPKRWEIRIEPDADGTVQIHRTNENFNAYELYGHLRLTLLDIERQISYSSEKTDSEILEKRRTK